MDRLDVGGRVSSVAGMAHDSSGQGSLNISDVIEVIQTTDPEFAEVDPLFCGTDMEDTKKKSIFVKIAEQPASKALRFRYECEGRSAGSIPGVTSTPENKTYPTIQVCGYIGPAVVVVSCVTKDAPYRAHPHNLVGKEGCKKGICTMRISVDTMTASFSNLGIQCVKKKDIEEALKVREEIRVDPFRSGFSHRNQPTSIDLNAVRLCFQVFIEDGERDKFTYPLTPVVSDPIYDKKAMSDLVICKLSDCSCTVAGGKEIILLCEKVAKEDIQIHFYEEQDGNIVWEGFADFQPTHVHKQVAISFRTPRYKSLEVEAAVKVHIQLRRPSDGATSEPLPFEYLPLDSGRPAFWSLRKALGKKGNYSIFSNILASNTALLTGGLARNGVDVPSHSRIRMVKQPHQAGTEAPIVPDGTALTQLVKPKNVVPSNVDGTTAAVAELADKSAMVENERSKVGSNNNNNNNNDDDVIMIDGADKKDKKMDDYNYAAINKWNAADSGAVDANANIQNEGDRKDDRVRSSDNEEVISQEETCRSLNELLSQVAELDEIYADTRARLLNQGVTETMSPDSVSPNLGGGQSAQVIEMDIEDVYDDDNQTYSSLQLAMKNPIELLDLVPGRYEDIIHQGLSNQSNKRDVSSTSLVPESPDTKLPPLPPKRIRRSPPTPPARPEHPIFLHEPPSTQAPDKILPPTPDGTNAKQLKPSLFQKLFSKKSKPSNKKEGSLTPRAASMSREESVANVSAAVSIRRGSEPVSQLDMPAQAQLELTEAEHYALYTDMAPHATVSEFDEMSFYYSPVEGGSIVTADPNVLKRKRHKYGGETNPHSLQQLEDLEKLKLQQQHQQITSSDQGPSSLLPHQMLPVIKMEPTDIKLPPPYVFQGGIRSPYTAMASPSPQPSISPHSAGRTPSPMDYGAPLSHPYQGMHGPGLLGYEQASVTYNMPARHTDFMSAGKVTRNLTADTASSGLGHVIHGVNDLNAGAGGITLFNNSPGMSTTTPNMMLTGIGGNASVLPGMASGHNSGIPVGASGMMGMNHISLGSLGIAQGLGSSATVPMNLAPVLELSGFNVPMTPNTAVTHNMGHAMTDGNILDLDNQQQFSLDSGDLVSMGLMEPNLSENLSSSLTLSENKQQLQLARDVEPVENMTDSFTSLTKEICTLNDMCKGSAVRDHQ